MPVSFLPPDVLRVFLVTVYCPLSHSSLKAAIHYEAGAPLAIESNDLGSWCWVRLGSEVSGIQMFFEATILRRRRSPAIDGVLFTESRCGASVPMGKR